MMNEIFPNVFMNNNVTLMILHICIEQIIIKNFNRD